MAAPSKRILDVVLRGDRCHAAKTEKPHDPARVLIATLKGKARQRSFQARLRRPLMRYWSPNTVAAWGPIAIVPLGAQMRNAVISLMIATGIGLAASGVGFAADMAVKVPPPPVAPQTPPLTWNGLYVGANMGGAVEHAAGTSNFLDTVAAGTAFAANPQSNGFNPAAFVGGGQIGYNWQRDPRWVIGVEGDWDFTNAVYSFCRQTNTLSAACSDNFFGFETIGSQTRWLSTARARLGVTVGNFLLYGTGGAAFGRVDTNLRQSCLLAGCGLSTTSLAASTSFQNTRAGWVAGLGVETPTIGNWSARLEWLHIDLGTITDAFATVGTGVETTVWSRSERYDVIRVGLDYRFWKS